jgi:circadian clock protein KaiB
LENESDITAQPAKHQFILFVSGMSVKSVLAIENLRKICDRYLADNFELQIVDISRDQEQASIHQIVAIPTLVVTGPNPRIILGDLSDTPKVLRILNIEE